VRLVVVLGAVNAIAPLSVDMYLPALPDIARGLSTSASQVQLTLTACVAGLALGQLLLGPLGVDVHEPGVHLTLDSTAISLDACVEIIAAAAVRR
jgi:hypothetical protein